MDHLTDVELQALADEELPEVRGRSLRLHVERCGDCARRLRSLAQEDREIAASLRLLDHAAPELQAGAIVARSRGGRRDLRRGLMAAGLSALFAAAAAAAVIPGTAINRYLERVLTGWRQTPPATSQPAPASPDVPRSSGVAFVPESEVEVVFLRPQSKGAISISLGAAPEVRVTSSGADAAYGLDAARVTIDNRSSDGSYEIVIPGRLPRARVRVGERTVFEKQGSTILTEVSRDSRGRYVVPFFADGEAKP
jgi:anti-sigma factor RsiW